MAGDAAHGHYFDATPGAPSARSTVAVTLPDLSFELQTDRGVFAADRVDPGTRVLLLEAPSAPPEARRIVDLGCGYGVIAVTLAQRSPEAEVWAVDVNERARQLCQDNARALGLSNVVVADPQDVPDDVEFDGLWSNPPIRIGKERLHALLRTWLERLRRDTHAYLVVQKHLGSDSLQRWLQAEGWPTERLASKAGYRVLDVTAVDP